MKRIYVMIFAVVATIFATDCMAQSTADQKKERKEISKLSKSELTARATKEARTAAREMAKDGWVVTPGALPIEKQLDKSYLMQYEYDEDLFPKYLMGEAMSIGENYDGAKMQALELAKQNLAGQIQTEINALIENTVANKQLEAEEAVSITESVLASKNVISQNIGRVLPVVEVYRVKENKNKEVLVRIAYNSEMALAAAKQAVRADLERKGLNLHKQLDNLLK